MATHIGRERERERRAGRGKTSTTPKPTNYLQNHQIKGLMLILTSCARDAVQRVGDGGRCQRERLKYGTGVRVAVDVGRCRWHNNNSAVNTLHKNGEKQQGISRSEPLRSRALCTIQFVQKKFYNIFFNIFHIIKLMFSILYIVFNIQKRTLNSL